MAYAQLSADCGAHRLIKKCKRCGMIWKWNGVMKEIETLVRQAQAGDDEAMGKLYQETNPRVYALALRLTKNREQAMDVVQETYLSAMQNIQKLQHPEAFMSWLYQIAAHQCHRLYRKEGKYVLTDQEEDGGTPYFESLPDPDEAILPHAATEQADTRRLMLELVDQLPEQQRECVLLFYFSGCGVEQIAELQNCSAGTVKSRLNYARKKLKEEIVAIEERDQVRFHTFLPLGLLFRCTAGELPDPSAFAETWQKVGVELGLSTAAAATGAAATAAGSQGAAGSATAAAPAKTTAAAALKVKVAAGLTAGAVVIGGGAAVLLHEPALTFVDPAMEHNVRLLLDKSSGALHSSDLESIDSLHLVDDGLAQEWSVNSTAPEGSQPLSSLEDLSLFPHLSYVRYRISDGGDLLQTLPSELSVTQLFFEDPILDTKNGVEDLSFLEQFPELEFLSIKLGEGVDLEPLESLETLQRLNFSFTGNLTLDLTYLSELHTLVFDNDSYRYNDTVFLQSDVALPNLKVLSTWDACGIDQLPELPEVMPNLEYLNFMVDDLTDLSPITQLTQLRLLETNFTYTGRAVIDLTPLLDCTNLELCMIWNLPEDAIVPAELPVALLGQPGSEEQFQEILDEIYAEINS